MKLLLIEDHPIVRAGCLRVLQQREETCFVSKFPPHFRARIALDSLDGYID